MHRPGFIQNYFVIPDLIMYDLISLIRNFPDVMYTLALYLTISDIKSFLNAIRCNKVIDERFYSESRHKDSILNKIGSLCKLVGQKRLSIEKHLKTEFPVHIILLDGSISTKLTLQCAKTSDDFYDYRDVDYEEEVTEVSLKSLDSGYNGYGRKNRHEEMFDAHIGLSNLCCEYCGELQLDPVVHIFLKAGAENCVNMFERITTVSVTTKIVIKCETCKDDYDASYKKHKIFTDSRKLSSEETRWRCKFVTEK